MCEHPIIPIILMIMGGLTIIILLYRSVIYVIGRSQLKKKNQTRLDYLYERDLKDLYASKSHVADLSDDLYRVITEHHNEIKELRLRVYKLEHKRSNNG